MTKPYVRRAPISDPSALIKILEEDGCVIATGFTTKEEVEQVNKDVKPYLDSPNDDKGTTMFQLPPETKRCTRLFGRSRTMREVWCQKPEWIAVIDHFLGTKSNHWHDDSVTKLSTNPLLSICLTLSVGPGAGYQPLHRDDFTFQQTHHQSHSTYPTGQDVGMGFFVPGIPTTKENGATLFIPGSHLWDDVNPPERADTVPAAMEVGECLIFLTSVFHAAGSNITTDENRMRHGAFFCRNWIRPGENHFPWFTKEEVATWSENAQVQAGYKLGPAPFLGNINLFEVKDMHRASGPLDPVWDDREKIAN